MSVLKIKVPFMDGNVEVKIDQIYTKADKAFSVTLVNSGIAEEITGNKAINILREEIGLPPLQNVEDEHY